MKKELEELTAELDQYISNGYLIADFNLPGRIIQIVARWVRSHDEGIMAPIVGNEYPYFDIPVSDLEELEKPQ